MRLSELNDNKIKRKAHLAKEANEKSPLWRLMYADFDYIHRDQQLVLNAIEAKLAEIEQLKDEISLLIDKAEIDHRTKENVHKLALKKLRKL